MFRLKFLFVVLAQPLFLAACSNPGVDDLKSYVKDVHAKPRGVIEPLPVFEPYESFLYSSTSMRSPFSPPIEIEEDAPIALNKDVVPNFDRVKEHLEQYPIGSMKFVGSLQKEDGQLWALLSQGSAVHKIKEGYYLGHNHGKVLTITARKIQIIEVVSNGLGGWMERPRTLVLKGLDGE